MYRIVLVDDEPLILAGITSLVDWEAEDCTIVGKSSNGPNAYELILKLQPDIVITDIRMPVLNGLELVAKCQAVGCSFSFIVLTNLEEFELARQAIILGATDYLVKLNLSSKELTQSLTKAKQACDSLIRMQEHQLLHTGTCDTEEMQIQTFFQSYMTAFDPANKEATCAMPKAMDSLSLETIYASPFCITISIRQDILSFDAAANAVSSSTQSVSYSYVSQQVADIITSIAKRSLSETVILLEYNKNTYLLIGSGLNESSYVTQIRQFGSKLLNALKNYFEYSAVCGISRHKDSFALLTEALLEAHTALEAYYYNASDHMIFYHGQTIHYSKAHSFNINVFKKELSICVQKNDAKQISAIFTQIIELFRECQPNKEQATSACINIYTYLYPFFETDDNSYDDIFPYTINIAEQLNRFYSLADILNWLEHFAERLSKLLADRQNTRSDKLVEQAKEYIATHYTEKFGLAEVSDSLNISSGYLSTNFKKYTGATLSDYIAEIKVSHAKEFIDTHHYLIYEISDMLGFDNPYYFSKVFKKVTGLSPKEYESCHKPDGSAG